jgi:hypothetical protein
MSNDLLNRGGGQPMRAGQAAFWPGLRAPPCGGTHRPLCAHPAGKPYLGVRLLLHA